jgi:hypothetical protein
LCKLAQVVKTGQGRGSQSRHILPGNSSLKTLLDFFEHIRSHRKSPEGRCRKWRGWGMCINVRFSARDTSSLFTIEGA